jgi:hypothetical protein
VPIFLISVFAAMPTIAILQIVIIDLFLPTGFKNNRTFREHFSQYLLAKKRWHEKNVSLHFSARLR